MRYQLRTLFILTAVVAAVCAIATRWDRGHRDMRAMLENRESPPLVSWRVVGQRRIVQCDRKAVLRFLEAALRKSISPCDAVGGTSYTFIFEFADGASYSVPACLSDRKNSFGLSMPGAFELGQQTHSVDLVEPLPVDVRRVITFLLAPREGLTSNTLILSGN